MYKYNNMSNYNKKIYIIIVLLLCLFFVLFVMLFTNKIFASDEMDKENNEEIIFQKNENPINLGQIIENNTQEKIKEEIVLEEVDMEYITKYKQNSELASGVVQVLQEGRTGKKNAIIIKKYNNDELISEEQVAENIIKAPIERIVEIGSGSKYNAYKIVENESAYVVSQSLAVKIESNEQSEKICTLNKNEEVKVLKINDEWCFILSNGIKGYIPINCITSKNPNQIKDDNNLQHSKTEILANLSYSIDLTKPSGASLEQFKKILLNDKNDKNNIFANNAEYFYYIEQQYKINGIFVAAVGIHESGWGTSTISINKKNLFGYGAVDSNPYGGAYLFNTYSEGIDLIARVFVKYYINNPQTQIYDGTIANGKFYSGNTISSVGVKYASDKNWANSVYKWMEYLYNKL